MTILGYLDNEIERYKKMIGNYPDKLTLSQSSFEKMRTEMKSHLNQDFNVVECWYHFKEPNYRGILIEIKGG